MAKTIYKNKKTISLSETFFNIASTITAIFVFVILVIFPLYTHDMYFDILGARYVFFKIATSLTMLLLMATGIIYVVVDTRSGLHEKSTLVRFIEALKIENLHKYVNWCDVFFLLMIISMTISTLGAHKKLTFDLLTEAFYGNAGRYQGLECWLMYFVMYVCVSRTYRFKRWHLDFAIVACAFASVWAVTDFYAMDIFGFLRNVSEGQKHQFSSSVGNLNTLTNYTCMGFAVAITLFVQEKNIFKSIFYAICALLCLEGCVFGLSDNAVIGVGFTYMVIPFVAVKDRRNIVKYVIALVILLLGVSSAYWGRLLPNHGWWWDAGSTFSDIGRISSVRWSTLFMAIVAVALIFIFNKTKMTESQKLAYQSIYDVPIDNIVIKVWTVIVCLGFAFIVYIFLDVNVLHKFDQQILNALAPFRNFLIFNDDWGTHRGHNWRIAFSNFARFNPFHKIFGYGPDTYLVITERTFYEEMVTRYGEVYDSAHNEYVNYLICEGALGLSSYIAIIVSSVVYGVKMLKENKFLAACIVAVIAYAGQAVVNIAIPITTPIYFGLMYVLVAAYVVHEKKNEEIRTAIR